MTKRLEGIETLCYVPKKSELRKAQTRRRHLKLTITNLFDHNVSFTGGGVRGRPNIVPQ